MAKQEFKAGLFTLIAMGILSMMLVAISGYKPWKQQIMYRTEFVTADGLSIGKPVKLHGMIVGSVTNMILDDSQGKVEVVFGLDGDRLLHPGVSAKITQQGLLGDNYLGLNYPKDKKISKENIKPGSLIPSSEKLSLAQAMDAFTGLAGKADSAMNRITESVEKVASGIDDIVVEAKVITANVNKVVLRGDKVMADIQELINKDRMDRLGQNVDKWQGLISDVLTDFRQVGSSVASLTERAQQTLAVIDSGVLKLTGDIKVAANDLTARAKQTLGVVDGGVNKLTGDAHDALAKAGSVADNLNQTIDRGDKILADVQRLVNSKEVDNLRRNINVWQGMVSDILTDFTHVSARINRMADSVDKLAAELKTAVSTDQRLVESILTTTDQELKSVKGSARRIAGGLEKTVADGRKKVISTLDEAQAAMARVRVAANRIDAIARKVDRTADYTLDDIMTIMDNLAEASRGLLAFSEKLREDPSLLLRGAKAR